MQEAVDIGCIEDNLESHNLCFKLLKTLLFALFLEVFCQDKKPLIPKFEVSFHRNLKAEKLIKV
jgi:hypothetical protein